MRVEGARGLFHLFRAVCTTVHGRVARALAVALAQHGARQAFRSEAIRWLIGQGLEVELKKREKRDRAPALSPKEGPA